MVVVKAAYFMEVAGGMPAAQIEAEHFTHLIYAFADIDRTTYEVVAHRVNNEERRRSLTNFCRVVRERNSEIKTLLSIGGAGDRNLLAAFSAMVGSSANRAAFIRSSIRLARDCGFNGLDLDYEVPETIADMQNVGILLREWRAAVYQETRGVCRMPLILTAAVRHISTNYDQHPYPTTSIKENLDWINVMSYDYSTSDRVDWGSPLATAFTSSLRGGITNGSDGVNNWVNAGVPASKIVFGIPFYGFAWNLVNPMNHGLGAPANGPYGNGGGSIKYRDILPLIGYQLPEFNGQLVECYSYNNQIWVSFNDARVVAAKVRYARDRGLLGYFAWQVAQDDNNFTLSKAAKNA